MRQHRVRYSSVSWRQLACLSGLPSAGDPHVSPPIISRPQTTNHKANRIMSADRSSPPVPETTSKYRPPSAVAGHAAGWIAAVILLSGIATHAYWLAGGSWVAGSDFEPLLPPRQAVTLTLGAAALLLTRIGVIPPRMPHWLLRIGSWALSVIFAVAASQSLFATTTRSGQEGWRCWTFRGRCFPCWPGCA